MKTNEFFDAMENIDPALIERADKKAVRKRPMIKIAAIAAAFALLAGLTIAVLPSMLKGDETIKDVVVWANIFTMFSPRNEDGLISGEIDPSNEAEIVIAESAFAEIISDDYADYTIGSVIPTAQNGVTIGEKLGEIEIRTGWYHHADGTESNVVTVKAEIYEIGGVASKAAVAVRYLEKGIFDNDFYSYKYYYAVNQNYELTTLADFFTDLNAGVYLNLSDYAILLEVPEDKSESIRIDKYRFSDGAGEAFSELLLSLDGDGEIVGYYEEAGVRLKRGARALELTFHLQTSSRFTHMIYVFDNGTIAIEGIGDGVAIFDIGADAADSLWDLFERSAHPEKGIYADDGLVEATTSAPVNEVVPE